jgi:glycosyltransferase involved in cell wall biosynthesis
MNTKFNINLKNNEKPKLLVYSITGNEARNAIFMHYLSDYFNILVVTKSSVNSKALVLSKPAKIKPQIFVFKQKIGFGFTPFISKIAQSWKPNFIISLESHSLSAYQSIKIAKKLKALSVIFTWQTVKTIPKLWIQKKLQKAIFRRSNFLIAGSVDSKLYLVNKGATPNKIHIIPESGYDSRIFSPEGDNLRNIWDYDSSEFVVLYSGRLVKEKGVEIILKAAESIEHNFKYIKFAFVGSGPLKDKVKNSGLSNVKYHGSYDFTDMGKVMRSCDLFIYPSISTKYWVEQFGYAPIEALACGKPVVVSNSGILRFFVDKKNNGTVIPEDSLELLELAIIAWFEKWKSKSIKIDIRKIEKYSASEIAKAYAEVLIFHEEKKYKANWY